MQKIAMPQQTRFPRTKKTQSAIALHNISPQTTQPQIREERELTLPPLRVERETASAQPNRSTRHRSTRRRSTRCASVTTRLSLQQRVKLSHSEVRIAPRLVCWWRYLYALDGRGGVAGSSFFCCAELVVESAAARGILGERDPGAVGRHCCCCCLGFGFEGEM
jgi:hypothetical protein